MEKVVLGHPEDLGQLLVVRRHHRRLRRLLGHRDEPVDVLDRAVGLLPEVELGGGLQLREPRGQVQLEALGRVEIDVLRLGCVLGDVGEVVPQDLAEPSELGVALVPEKDSTCLLEALPPQCNDGRTSKKKRPREATRQPAFLKGANASSTRGFVVIDARARCAEFTGVQKIWGFEW